MIKNGFARGALALAALALAALSLTAPRPAAAQEKPAGGRNYRIETAGTFEWEAMRLNVTVTLDLRSAGIRLPAGRSQAEEIIRQEYAVLTRPYLLSVPVDSASTLGDLIRRGEYDFFGPEEIAARALRAAPALSPDLNQMTALYTIDLTIPGATLIRHRQPGEMPRVLSPVPSGAYTGVIIIAQGLLPVHGRNSTARVEPCLFPKIWDSAMNLIFERNMLAVDGRGSMVHYAGESAIFRDSPSGLSPEVEAVVGPNPLRIIAGGVFGERPTDPVISHDDALSVLSGENNRSLLRNGKIVIILDDSVLATTIREN